MRDKWVVMPPQRVAYSWRSNEKSRACARAQDGRALGSRFLDNSRKQRAPKRVRFQRSGRQDRHGSGAPVIRAVETTTAMPMRATEHAQSALGTEKRGMRSDRPSRQRSLGIEAKVATNVVPTSRSSIA